MQRLNPIIILSFATLLAACAATVTAPKAPPSLDNFTTEGKPTKTVLTPWGNKQVYDPTQDAEITAAYKYVHQTALEDESRDRYNALFRRIHQIQHTDLMRIGCGAATMNGCAGFLFESKAPFVCSNNLSMGKAELNICEAENTTHLLPGSFIGSCEFGPDNKYYQGTLKYEYIGQNTVNGVRSANEEIQYFFNSQCNFFTDENDEKKLVK